MKKEGLAVKYESNEALELIFEKSKKIRAGRERRKTAVLGVASSVLAVLLIATVILLKGQTVSEATASHLGAFLLPSEAGGYVIAGVLAFILGILITTIVLRYSEKRKERKKDQ